MSIIAHVYFYIRFGTAENFALRAGSSIRDEAGTLHQAELVISHPKYENHDYDFALIKVKNSFPLGQPGVEVVELAEEEPVKDEIATVSGWGYLAVSIHAELI